MRYVLCVFIVLWCVLPSAAGERWALLVGVDTYETQQITPLNYAVRDVTAVAEVMKRTGVPENNIFLLTDQGKGRSLATGTNIIWRLGWLAQRMQPDDTLLFYFSGHGMEKGGSTYLLSYDSDIGSEVTLKRTAVRMAELQEISSSMKASTIITFMDACRNDPQAGKSVSTPNALSKGMAKDLALIAAPETEQHKTLNVTFYSCSPGERSWESEETSHGFFSYHVMKGLLGEAADANGQITVNSLETYLTQVVPSSVDRAIGMRQTPWTNRQGTAGGTLVLNSVDPAQDTKLPSLASIPSLQPPARSQSTDAATTPATRRFKTYTFEDLGFRLEALEGARISEYTAESTVSQQMRTAKILEFPNDSKATFFETDNYQRYTKVKKCPEIKIGSKTVHFWPSPANTIQCTVDKKWFIVFSYADSSRRAERTEEFLRIVRSFEHFD